MSALLATADLRRVAPVHRVHTVAGLVGARIGEYGLSVYRRADAVHDL